MLSIFPNVAIALRINVVISDE